MYLPDKNKLINIIQYKCYRKIDYINLKRFNRCVCSIKRFKSNKSIMIPNTFFNIMYFILIKNTQS